MKKNTSSKINIVLMYAMPMLLSAVIFGLVLAIKGMAPFGSETIDYYDMAQQVEAYYHQIFDELHGEKSIFFDWYSSLGRGIPGGTFLSFSNILLYFTSRNHIMEYFSIIMTVYVMLNALTMYIFLKNIGNAPYAFCLLLSVGYGISGFMLMNYTIPQWMDATLVVPLVFLFSQKVLNNEKVWGLAFSVFYLFLNNYYLALMVIVYLFLAGGGYVIYNHFVSKRELQLLKWLVTIVLGIFSAGFSWIPRVYLAFSSARIKNGTTSGGLFDQYIDILKQQTPAFISRWWVLLGISFPLAVIVIGMLKDIKRKKILRVTFLLYLISLIMWELLLESIQLIMHFGSYVNYPVRNGFLLYCSLAAMACVYYEKYCVMKDGKTPPSIAVILEAVIALGSIIVFCMWYENHPGLPARTVLWITAGIMAVTFLIYILLLNSKMSPKSKFIFSVPIWITEVIIFGFIFVGHPSYEANYANQPEQEGEYIRITNQLVPNFNLQPSCIERVKNPDTSLNANYGMIMKRPTLSGWTSMAPTELLLGSSRMGYNVQFTRLLDSGANVFSDSLLHFTQTISFIQQDPNIYDEVANARVIIDNQTGEETTYYLYDNKYVLPFGLLLNNSTEAADIQNSLFPESVVEMMNTFYRGIKLSEVKGSDSIASYISQQYRDGTNMIDIKGKKALYFCGDSVDQEYYNTEIRVNGEVVPVPSIHENDNTLFPAHFNNHTLFLGTYENESVLVEISRDLSDKETDYSYQLYTIDLSVLQSLCDEIKDNNFVSFVGKRNIEFEICNNHSNALLIPIAYDRGWSATVNGENAYIANVNNTFMCVPLKEGECKIKLTYLPVGTKAAVIYSVIALIVLIIFSRMVEEKKDCKTVKTNSFLSNIYIGSWLLANVIVFIVPIFYAVLTRLHMV